ncbi:MAG: RNA polymerase sigma factor [Thermoleophilia bacterium]
MRSHATDNELVEAVRAGSGPAADTLFERYWPLAWRTAYAVLGDRSGADDAAQRAVERAIRGLHTFRAGARFGPWIRRIAVNQALDALRRGPREAPLPETLAGPDVYDEILDRHAIAGAVARLDDDRRVVVAMRYWLDMDPREIADALGVPVGTVSSRLSRALTDLRQQLEVPER